MTRIAIIRKGTLITAGILCLLMSLLLFAEAIINRDGRENALAFAIALMFAGIRGVWPGRGSSLFMGVVALTLVLALLSPIIAILVAGLSLEQAPGIVALVNHFYLIGAAVVLVLLAIERLLFARTKMNRNGKSDGTSRQDGESESLLQ